MAKCAGLRLLEVLDDQCRRFYPRRELLAADASQSGGVEVKGQYVMAGSGAGRARGVYETLIAIMHIFCYNGTDEFSRASMGVRRCHRSNWVKQSDPGNELPENPNPLLLAARNRILSRLSQVR